MSDRPRFVLVRCTLEGEHHALPPGVMDSVETLCGELIATECARDGFTVLVDRITCRTCQTRARAIVAEQEAKP